MSLYEGFPETAAPQSTERRRIGLLGPPTDTRESVAHLLRSFGHECVAAHEAGALPPDLDAVVVSAHPEIDDVVDAVREARETRPGCPIVAVAPSEAASELRRVLRAGAQALIAEPRGERLLATTISAVCSGLTCVPSEFRALLAAEALSMREKQILGMVVRGCANAEIAEKLFLAESTVKSHLSSAYSKLGVQSRAAAANLILDPDEGLGPGILAISAA